MSNINYDNFISKRKIKVERSNGIIENNWYYICNLKIEPIQKINNNDENCVLVTNNKSYKYITKEKLLELNPDFEFNIK